MANFSMQGQQLSQRQLYEQKYKISRMNLLLVVIFTAVNLLLLVTNADSYFLFSAFVPYFITYIGMLACGRFPAEYYTDELADMTFLDNSFFVILLVISVVLTLLYLLAWLMSSKNRVGWLIFALIFFGLDTIGMFLISGFAVDSIIDILFHGWVIYYLILGITSHYKLKNLPPEEDAVFSTAENAAQPIEGNAEGAEPVVAEMQNTPVIRVADKDVKYRVLLEATAFHYDICYRRVKHTNELVINGNVYDELEGIVEYPHTLTAQIDGHCITASYTGTHSVITVDGENIAKKVRLV